MRTLFGEPRISESFSPRETIVLHCGDAFEFLKALPSNFVSLVVISPPYNLGKEYERKKALEIYLQAWPLGRAELSANPFVPEPSLALPRLGQASRSSPIHFVQE